MRRTSLNFAISPRSSTWRCVQVSGQVLWMGQARMIFALRLADVGCGVSAGFIRKLVHWFCSQDTLRVNGFVEHTIENFAADRTNGPGRGARKSSRRGSRGVVCIEAAGCKSCLL